MELTLKGPWSPREVEAFLAEVRVPVRLACNGTSGHPVLASLWFVARGTGLWCATQRSSRVASLLAADPRCAFEVAEEKPPYRGVRGQGLATLHDERGEEVLRKLIQRYLGDTGSDLARWLLARSAGETAISIEPHALFSWDYRDRMAGTS